MTAAFSAAENTQKQWASFVKRSKLGSAPEKFDELCEPLRKFLTNGEGARQRRAVRRDVEGSRPLAVAVTVMKVVTGLVAGAI